MQGVAANRGVNYRALSEVFKLKQERRSLYSYTITVSMMEIYCEIIRDLLKPPSKRRELKLKELAAGEILIDGLTELEAQSEADILNAMALGESYRSTEYTAMNDVSSRSHSVVRITIHAQHLGSEKSFIAKMHLIDLAGSERLSKSLAVGQRAIEARAINSSLAALGNVLESLQHHNAHIPYRDSKLTHLLKDSLGGNAKALMFINVSPSDSDTKESFCSLNFGSRARKVEIGEKAAKRWAKLKESVSVVPNNSGNNENSGDSAPVPPSPGGRRASISLRSIVLAAATASKSKDSSLTDPKAMGAKIAELEAQIKDWQSKNSELRGDLEEANSALDHINRQLMEEQAKVGELSGNPIAGKALKSLQTPQKGSKAGMSEPNQRGNGENYERQIAELENLLSSSEKERKQWKERAEIRLEEQLRAYQAENSGKSAENSKSITTIDENAPLSGSSLWKNKLSKLMGAKNGQAPQENDVQTINRLNNEVNELRVAVKHHEMNERKIKEFLRERGLNITESPSPLNRELIKFTGVSELENASGGSNYTASSAVSSPNSSVSLELNRLLAQVRDYEGKLAAAKKNEYAARAEAKSSAEKLSSKHLEELELLKKTVEEYKKNYQLLQVKLKTSKFSTEKEALKQHQNDMSELQTRLENASRESVGQLEKQKAELLAKLNAQMAKNSELKEVIRKEIERRNQLEALIKQFIVALKQSQPLKEGGILLTLPLQSNDSQSSENSSENGENKGESNNGAEATIQTGNIDVQALIAQANALAADSAASNSLSLALISSATSPRGHSRTPSIGSLKSPTPLSERSLSYTEPSSFASPNVVPPLNFAKSPLSSTTGSYNNGSISLTSPQSANSAASATTPTRRMSIIEKNRLSAGKTASRARTVSAAALTAALADGPPSDSSSANTTPRLGPAASVVAALQAEKEKKENASGHKRITPTATNSGAAGKSGWSRLASLAKPRVVTKKLSDQNSDKSAADSTSDDTTF
jgi:hypothetical protein